MFVTTPITVDGAKINTLRLYSEETIHVDNSMTSSGAVVLEGSDVAIMDDIAADSLLIQTRQYSGDPIELGTGGPGGGALALDQTEIDHLTVAGTLSIGDYDQSGDVTVTAPVGIEPGHAAQLRIETTAGVMINSELDAHQFLIAANNPVVVSASGILGGNGTVEADLQVSGILEPGTSPGTITVNGDLTLNAGSRLNIQLTGTAVPGTDYDQVAVDGNVALDGTLAFEEIAPFTVSNLETFTVMTWTGTNPGDSDFAAISPSFGDTYSGDATRNDGDYIASVTGSDDYHFWVGSPAGGDWSVGTNWNKGTAPGATDDVYIPAGNLVDVAAGNAQVRRLIAEGGLSVANRTLTVNDTTSIVGDLYLGGASGQIAGVGEISVIGDFYFNQGTLNSTWEFETQAGSTIGATGDTFLTNGLWKNEGLAVWVDNDFTITAPAVFRNESGGTFRVASGMPAPQLFGSGTIENAGTFEALSPVAVYPSFTNEGGALLDAGQNTTFYGSTVNAGTYRIAGGMLINLLGANHTFSGGDMEGGFLNLGPTSTLNVDSGVWFSMDTTTLYLYGDLNIGSGADLVLYDTFYFWQGDVAGNGTLETKATTMMGGSGNVSVTDVTWNNYGSTAWINNDMALGGTAELNNLPGATFSIASTGSYTDAGTTSINNAGEFVLDAGGGTKTFLGDFNNSGYVYLLSGFGEFADYTQTDGYTFLSGGNFTGNIQLDNGILKGEGSISGDVNNTGGTVAPGGSIGWLSMTNYLQGPGGTLDIELNGTAWGSTYDALSVTGTASLGGALNVSMGFAGSVGDLFDIISGNVAGDFASKNLSAGYGMTATPFGTYYQLEITGVPPPETGEADTGPIPPEDGTPGGLPPEPPDDGTGGSTGDIPAAVVQASTAEISGAVLVLEDQSDGDGPSVTVVVVNEPEADGDDDEDKMKKGRLVCRCKKK